MPVSQAMQMAQAPIPGDWAYLSGRVTYNGDYQDGVSVSLPGGSSDITKDGGYYKLSAYPNIAVSVSVSYKGATLTRAVETGGESSNTTYNFDLVAVATPTVVVSPTPTPVPENVCLAGTVTYDNSPLPGVFVQIWPYTKVKTDMSGKYMATVPFGQNLSISVETPAGVTTKNVTSPVGEADMVVDFNVAKAAATVTPIPITPTPVPAVSAPAGNETITVLSVAGLLAAIGLFRLRKE